MVVQLGPSQQPFVAFGFVHITVNHGLRKQSFDLVNGKQ